ncbi:MAG: biotin--[acetyl-CoA-carboxylase] ligase [Gallionella sp.]|nr:biotin--[acetyl-CoA-carboxylase] ligase [Gallionella sp.]
MRARTWQLLRLLADGKFHSGEEMGARLGVSRATVFNELEAVAVWGIALQRIRGRGYRLTRPWQVLDVGVVTAALGEAAGRFEIEVMQQAASSNTELLRRAALGAPSGTVLAVELQTAGRGRIGRAWHSGLGNALTFSLLWRFDCGLNALSGLSLAVGVAIIRALQRVGVAGAGLKWPNDILCAEVKLGAGGKLGGVLIEAQGDMYGPSAVVIGIGLNCYLPPDIEQAISQRAAAIDPLCATMPERNILLAVLLQELAAVLDVVALSGFAALRDEWERFHALKDSAIRLQMPDGSTVNGIARGVSDAGELRLETAQGVGLFNSGEVGVRQ